MNATGHLQKLIENNYFRLASWIFAIDFFTKTLAQIFLPPEKVVRLVGDNLYFYLSINSSGIGYSQEASLIQNGYSINTSFFASFLFLALSIYIVAVQNYKISTRYKWLGGVILFIAGGYVLLAFEDSYSAFNINPTVIALTRGISSSILLYIFFKIFKNGLLRTVCILVISANLGNMVNLLLPPFGFVDFIFIEPLYRITRTQVCNFADITLDVAKLLFLISIIWLPISALFNKARANHKQNTV